MRRVIATEPYGMDGTSYRVILEPESDGSAYNVIVPAFPHAHTFGESVSEAMANAREVLELEVGRERGELRKLL